MASSNRRRRCPLRTNSPHICLPWTPSEVHVLPIEILHFEPRHVLHSSGIYWYWHCFQQYIRWSVRSQLSPFPRGFHLLTFGTCSGHFYCHRRNYGWRWKLHPDITVHFVRSVNGRLYYSEEVNCGTGEPLRFFQCPDANSTNLSAVPTFAYLLDSTLSRSSSSMSAWHWFPLQRSFD